MAGRLWGLPLAAWLCVACGWLDRGAEAKMVMGIASGQDFQLVSTFCFTFPPPPALGLPPPNGRIHSQTIVSSMNHKFLLLNYTDLQMGLPCSALESRAKVIEPLTERTTEVVAYDLTLNVEPSMQGQHIAAVIVRCDMPLSAEYIVEFTNPGGYSVQHFACAEQGLLEGYTWLSVIVMLLAPCVWSAQRVLHRRQAHNDLSAIFFTGAAFFGARIVLFTVHLLVYSRNGMGLGMLLFVAQFLDFVSNTMAMLVLVALVHGVYVTRPMVPVGSDERTLLMQVIGVFTGTLLLSTLLCGFKTDAPLSPFAVLRGGLSTPYLFVRLCTGVFCFKRSVRLAAEEDAQSKKHLIVRFGIIALGWLALMPVVMLFTSEEAWTHSAIFIDCMTLGMFSAVLYDFWPSRFGTLFSCTKPTERMHPYSEFGVD